MTADYQNVVAHSDVQSPEDCEESRMKPRILEKRGAT